MKPVSLVCTLMAASLFLGSCLTSDAVVEKRTYAPSSGALERVAVIPFYAHRSYEGSSRLGGVPADTAAERVTRLVSDALVDRGVNVVPQGEVSTAIANVQRNSAAIDTGIYAELAGRKLAASGVIVGEVLRFREPRGASGSARRPASVAFELTLYEVPTAFKLWTARFDETQSVPDANLPSGYDRAELQIDWRSAEEIARRGAEAVVKALAQEP